MEGIFVSTIYCDDVRQEVGGKHSFMGVYNSDMLIPEFPANIGKLCAQITVRLPIETRAENMVIKILNVEDIVAEIPLPEGQLQAMRKQILANESDPSELQFLGVVVGLQITPLLLDKPGKFRSIAVVDGNEVRGNSLAIRRPTDAEFAAREASLRQ